MTVVGLFAGAVNAYYGPRGFMPLDHSVVFDGGWRTLAARSPSATTRRPTRSPIIAPGAVLPGVRRHMEGVRAPRHRFQRALRSPRLRSPAARWRPAARRRALRGLSGLVFYPPLGVPFHDQHAFFFVLLAITLGVAARRAGGHVDTRPLGDRSIRVTAAALSKQTPTLLGVPIVLGLAFVRRRRLRRALSCLIAGSTASVVLVVGADRGPRRLAARLGILRRAASRDREERGGRADGTAASFFVLAALFVRAGRRAVDRRRQVRGGPVDSRHGVALPLALSAAFMACAAAFISPDTQRAHGRMPLFFASSACSRSPSAVRLPDLAARRSRLGGDCRRGHLAIVALVAGWSYNNQVNERRSASNIIYDEALVEARFAIRALVDALPGTERYDGHARFGPRRVVEYLRSRSRRLRLLRRHDRPQRAHRYTFRIPGSLPPPRLTIPERGNDALERFERRLFDRSKHEGVRRVVVERRTWEGGQLSSLPRFSEWLAQLCRRTTDVRLLRGHRDPGSAAMLVGLRDSRAKLWA